MDLAFDREGNPFRFRSQTRKLRPRRWKHAGQRGTCAAVLDPDGEQLFIEADADFAEFRAAVRNSPGFYRLDQCDGDGIALEDAPPAYVTIESTRNASMQSESDPRDAIIRDLAQALADSNRTLTEQFSSVMNATAVVLRAADGAGLPRREPPPPVSAPADDDDDDDDDDQDNHDDADEHRPEPAEKLWAIIEQMLPSIQMWLAAMAASRTSPTPAAAPPSTPEPAAPSAPAASSAAPIVDGVAAGPSTPEFPGAAATVAAGRTVSAVSAVSAPALGPSTPPLAAPSADSIPVAAPSAAIATAVNAPIPEPRNAPPSAEPTPEQWAHLMAIRTRLSRHELAIAERVLVRMTTEMRRQWLAELSTYSVDEATEIVRSMIPRQAPTNRGKRDGTR